MVKNSDKVQGEGPKYFCSDVNFQVFIIDAISPWLNPSEGLIALFRGKYMAFLRPIKEDY